MADEARMGTAAMAGWSPARMFMAASAAYHLLLAVPGLVIDQSFPVGSAATVQAGSEYIFGVFETNGWHSVAALLVGLVSLYFAVRPEHVRLAALALGISQAVVLVAFAVEPPSTFWFASNGADQVVHGLTAVGGVAAALLNPPGGHPPDGRQSPNRRGQSSP